MNSDIIYQKSFSYILKSNLKIIKNFSHVEVQSKNLDLFFGSLIFSSWVFLSVLQFLLCCFTSKVAAWASATTLIFQWAGTEHQTCSQSGKEYVKSVYCHTANLSYMPSTSYESSSWMKQELESRSLGEISITSDMQMTPPSWRKVKKN